MFWEKLSSFPDYIGLEKYSCLQKKTSCTSQLFNRFNKLGKHLQLQAVFLSPVISHSPYFSVTCKMYVNWNYFSRVFQENVIIFKLCHLSSSLISSSIFSLLVLFLFPYLFAALFNSSNLHFQFDIKLIKWNNSNNWMVFSDNFKHFEL